MIFLKISLVSATFGTIEKAVFTTVAKVTVISVQESEYLQCMQHVLQLEDIGDDFSSLINHNLSKKSFNIIRYKYQVADFICNFCDLVIVFIVALCVMLMGLSCCIAFCFCRRNHKLRIKSSIEDKA